MVPRIEGAQAYHDTVHRRVDPALLEWAGAGVFNARVFPLEPGKLHRIVFAYDVDLQRVGEELQWSMDLPKDLPESLVEVAVVGALDQSLSLSPETEITKAAGLRRAVWKNLKGQTLTLRLKASGPSLLVGQDKALGDHFALSCQVPALGEMNEKGAEKAVFLVDVSLSAKPDRFNVQLALMEAILRSNSSEIREFAVLFFNIESFWYKPGFSKNSAEELEELRRFAEGLALEGASDLELALRTAARPSWAEASLAEHDVFLLSDAAVTWGELNSEVIAVTASGLGRVFSYRTGLSGENDRLLEGIARASGGAVFSVVGAAEVAAAARAHRARPWTILNLSLAACSDVLIRGCPGALYSDQHLVLAGRGRPEAGAKLCLELQRGEQRKKLEIELPKAVESELAPRVYGEILTTCLEDVLGVEAVDTAIHYRVLRRSCSLIVHGGFGDGPFGLDPEELRPTALDRLEAERDQVIHAGEGARGREARVRLRWLLDRHQGIPGEDAGLRAVLSEFVEGAGAELLILQTENLVCKSRRRVMIPSRFVLSRWPGDFDAVVIDKEAERRRKSLGVNDALKLLSSQVESRPGDLEIAYDLAIAALAWGRPEQAYHLFLRIAESGPFEPQLYHDLARCCEEALASELAVFWYELALREWAALAVFGPWGDMPFSQSRRVYFVEEEECWDDYRHLLRQLVAGKIRLEGLSVGKARLDALAKELPFRPVAFRVSLIWSDGASDVDLHVLEPGEERAFYGNLRTESGGELLIGGAAQESYRHARPCPGRYRLGVQFYPSKKSRLSERTRCLLTMTKNPGQDNQETRRKAVLLTAEDHSKEIYDFIWE